MRSCFAPAFRLGWDTSNQGIDHALLRKTVDDFRRVEKYLLGDFYPLTTYSLGEDMWLAWQFDRPEQGEGMIQAFRRHNSSSEPARFKLQGLEAKGSYAITSLDDPATRQKLTGSDLMGQGLRVDIPAQAGSALFTYHKLK
jgi:alpha-galactosidase